MHILSWSTRPGLGHVGLPATRTLAGTGACWRDWDGPACQGTRRGSRTQSAARPTLCLLPTCVLRPARRSGLRWNGAMRAKPWRPRRSFSSYTSKYSHSKEHPSPGAHRSSRLSPYAPSTFLQAHPPLNHPAVVFASRTGSADGVHRRAAASSWARTALATGSGTDRAQGSRSTPRWALAMAAARRPSARHAALQQRKKAVFRPGRTGAVISSRAAPFATADRHQRHTERLEAANSMQNVLGRALNVIRLHYL